MVTGLVYFTHFLRLHLCFYRNTGHKCIAKSVFSNSNFSPGLYDAIDIYHVYVFYVDILMNTGEVKVMSLNIIPKVVLHEHIEGAITPDIACKLARKYGVTIPEDYLDLSGRKINIDNRGFSSFIKVYDFFASLIRDEDDYYIVTKDYLERNAKLGLIYCELISSPLHMAPGKEKYFDCKQYKACLDSIRAAINEVHNQYGLITKLHVVAIRHLGLMHIASVIDLADNNQDDLVVGLNIAGDEREGSFQEISELTNRTVLMKSFHAGEICGPESIHQAIEAGAVRIGHGINAIYDDVLIDRLISENILLEISITSNLTLLNEYRDDPSLHPVKKLYNAGVRINLNTDDAGIFDTDIGKEYNIARDIYGFSDAELLDISLCALEASFIGDDKKSTLLNRVYCDFGEQDILELKLKAYSQDISLALQERLVKRIADIDTLMISLKS